MANYCCATRTNYFRVKDPESFKSFMYTVYGSEEPVDVWEETDRSGETKKNTRNRVTMILSKGCNDTLLTMTLSSS